MEQTTVKILYPIPLDNAECWAEFRPFVKRFCDTFRQHTPGAECDIVGICCNKPVTDEVRELFANLPVRFAQYIGEGCDIGGCQWMSHQLVGNPFLVNCTSRVYFHRPNWLLPLIAAREEFGPGLYLCSVNRDSHRVHGCTRFYSMDARFMRAYPYVIDSRKRGPLFEVGENNPDGNLMEWFKSRGQVVKLVTFDGAYSYPSFHPPNSFRMGDQSAMLAWDKHTDLWAQAGPEERATLTRNMLL